MLELIVNYNSLSPFIISPLKSDLCIVFEDAFPFIIQVETFVI